MNTVELKNILIHKISEINDVSFLKAIKTILDSKTDNRVLTLTPEQHMEISSSRKEMEEGLFVTQAQLNKEMDVWMNK